MATLEGDRFHPFGQVANGAGVEIASFDRAVTALACAGDGSLVVALDGQSRAAIGDRTQWGTFSPYLLDQVTSLHAMTVHKAQGSQFRQVTVVLPPPDSPLLTRELLYTAVTRASQSVHLVGDPESVRRAVENPAGRSSGLARGW